MVDEPFWHLLGLTDLDRDLYRVAVAQPGAGLERWARQLAADVDEVGESLERLVTLELARHTPAGPVVAEPRTALTALARRHQATLDRAGLIAEDLAATYAAGQLHATPERLIEVLRSDEIGDRLVELLSSARRTIDATAAPPYVSGADPVVEAAELRALGRGVRFRSIYDSTSLDHPALVSSMTATAAAGELARVMPGLRTKMIVVDESVALLPLARRPVDGEVHAVVVSYSAMSDALGLLFQSLWDKASPLQLGVGPAPATRRGGPDRALLTLLAAGMSDTAIARQLGISERTLRRRVTALQEHLSASSRFQLGAVAARRGLLPGP